MSDDANVWNPRDAVATVSNYSSMFKERFLAAAGQQTFTLTAFAYQVGINTLLVYKNGLLLEPGVEYSETNETTLNLTAGAAANDIILAIGFIGLVGGETDLSNLGSAAVAPTVDKLGAALGTDQAGYFYWSTATNNHWTWTGTVWQLTSSSVATSANLVAVTDAGGYYTASEVETILQEIGADLVNKSRRLFYSTTDAAADKFTAPWFKIVSTGVAGKVQLEWNAAAGAVIDVMHRKGSDAGAWNSAVMASGAPVSVTLAGHDVLEVMLKDTTNNLSATITFSYHNTLNVEVEVHWNK